MKTTDKKQADDQVECPSLETPTQRKMHGAKRESEFAGEHYHGERQLDIDEQPGDIEEETLDREAPFNNSYGLR